MIIGRLSDGETKRPIDQVTRRFKKVAEFENEDAPTAYKILP